MSLKIFVEGLPLTGKSTFCKILLEYYKLKGYDVNYIEDIYDNSIGFTLKNLLNQSEVDPRVNFFLSCASILKSFNNLQKKLNSHDIIIFENVLTYPILMLFISNDKNLEDIFYNFIKMIDKPHIIFVLDCSKKEFEKRRKKHDIPRFFDIYGFDNLKNSYSYLLKVYSNILKINTEKEPVEVFKEVKDIIDQHLYNF